MGRDRQFFLKANRLFGILNVISIAQLRADFPCVNFAGLGSVVLCVVLHCGICNGRRQVNKIKWLKSKQGTLNPFVVGSTPTWPTKKAKACRILRCAFFLYIRRLSNKFANRINFFSLELFNSVRSGWVWMAGQPLPSFPFRFCPRIVEREPFINGFFIHCRILIKPCQAVWKPKLMMRVPGILLIAFHLKNVCEPITVQPLLPFPGRAAILAAILVGGMSALPGGVDRFSEP